MKLCLSCEECHDVRRMFTTTRIRCRCGLAWGGLEGEGGAWVGGAGYVLNIEQGKTEEYAQNVRRLGGRGGDRQSIYGRERADR